MRCLYVCTSSIVPAATDCELLCCFIRPFIVSARESRHNNQGLSAQMDFKTSCGLGPWRPSWLQKCASKEVKISFSLNTLYQQLLFRCM